MKKVMLALLIALFSTTVHTQTVKSADAGGEKIKAMLLRPGGWIVEWRGNSQGVSDYIFEDRGEKVVVKNQYTSYEYGL